MKDKARARSCVTAFLAALAIIANFVTIWGTQDFTVRLATVCSTLTILIIATYFYFKASGHETAIIEAGKILKETDKLLVKPVQTEAQLREVWEIDSDIFNESVSLKAGISWWKKYSQGVYALYKGNVLQGYMSLWPLTKTAFHEFCEGKKKETDISSRNIIKKDNYTDTSYWYIGSIVLEPKMRRTAAFRYLVQQAMAQWLTNIDVKGRIKLCALAYTKMGENSLRKFGFSKFSDGSQNIHKHSVYVMETTHEELSVGLEAILGNSKGNTNGPSCSVLGVTAL